MFFRKKVNELDENYESDNWDDLDDLDLGGFETTETQTGVREPVTKFVGSFTQGMKDSVLDKAIHRNIIKDSLPREYVSHYNDILDTSRTVEDLYDTVSKEVKKTHDAYRKELKPIIDNRYKKSPNKITSILKKWADKAKADPETKKNLEPTLNELAQAAVNDTLDEGTDTLRRLQAKNDIEKSEINVTDSRVKILQGVRQTEILANIDNSLDKQTAFNEQVAVRFKRKTLELQFKQYFTARKQLETSNQVKDLLAKSIPDIIKNTGLPDARKIQLSEATRAMFRDKWLGEIHDQTLGGFKDKIGQFTSRVGARVGETLKNIRSNSSTIGLLSLGDELNSEFGDKQSWTDRLIDLAGDQLGSQAGKFLLTKGVKTGVDFGERHGLDVEDVNAQTMLGKQLTPYMINDALANNNGGGFVNTFLRWVGASDLAPDQVSTLSSSPEKYKRDQALFDIETRNSITYQIPTLLSEIHGEVRTFREAVAPYTKLDRGSLLRMDWKTGRLNTTENVTKSRTQDIFGKSRREKVTAVGKEYLKRLGHEEYDKDGNLVDPDTGEIILGSDAVSGLAQELQVSVYDKSKPFDLVNIVNKNNKVIEDDNVADDLSQFFKTYHEINEDSVNLSTSDNLARDFNLKRKQDTKKANRANALALSHIENIRKYDNTMQMYSNWLKTDGSDIAANEGVIGLTESGATTFEPVADLKRLFDKDYDDQRRERLSDLQRDGYSDKYSAISEANAKNVADAKRRLRNIKRKREMDEKLAKQLDDGADIIKTKVKDFNKMLWGNRVQDTVDYIGQVTDEVVRYYDSVKAKTSNSSFNPLRSKQSNNTEEVDNDSVEIQDTEEQYPKRPFKATPVKPTRGYFGTFSSKNKEERKSKPVAERGEPTLTEKKKPRKINSSLRYRPVRITVGSLESLIKRKKESDIESLDEHPIDVVDEPKDTEPKAPVFRSTRSKPTVGRFSSVVDNKFKPAEEQYPKAPMNARHLATKILKRLDVQVKKIDNHFLGGTVGGIYRFIKNFADGGSVTVDEDALVNSLSKGLANKLHSLSGSNIITDMLGRAINAEIDAGGDPQVVVADRGEEIISNKDNEADIFRAFKNEGLWDDIKARYDGFKSREIGKDTSESTDTKVEEKETFVPEPTTSGMSNEQFEIIIDHLDDLTNKFEALLIAEGGNAPDKKKPGFIKKVLSGGFGVTSKLYKDYYSGIKNLGRAVIGKDSACDVYIVGDETPVITKTEMKRGIFFDKESGEPIKRLGDIKGDVVDIEGMTVISAKDIAEDRVVSPSGKPIKGLIGISIDALSKIVTGGFGLAKFTLGGTFGLAKFSIDTTAKMWGGLLGPKQRKLKRGDDDFIVEDIYVKGERRPAILAKDVKRGMYVDSDGNTVERYGDLKPPIYDINGVIVLDEEEFEHGLVFPDGSVVGKVLRSGFNFVGNLASTGLDFAGFGAKASGGILKALASGGLKLAGAAFDGVGKFFNFLGMGGDDFGGLKGSKYTMMLQTQAAAVDKLELIRLLLDARMPDKDGKYNDVDEDGHRDGSFYAKLKKKQEEEKENTLLNKLSNVFSSNKDKDGKDKDGKGGFLGNLMQGIGGVMTAGPVVAAIGGTLIALFGPQLVDMLKHGMKSVLPSALGGYTEKEKQNKSFLDAFAGTSKASPNLPHNPEDLQVGDEPILPEEVEEPGWFESRPFWQRALLGYMGVRHAPTIIKGGAKATGFLGKGVGKAIQWGAGKAGLTARMGLSGMGKREAAKHLVKSAPGAIRTAGSFLGRFAGKQALRTGVTTAMGALAGSGGTAAASTAAAGGAAGAGGIGAALASNPVGWGIAAALAVGAVAYGGYKLYKHLSTKNDNLLFELRMKQYGYSHKDENMVSKILEFENYLETHTSRASANTEAKVTNSADDSVAYRIFGINPSDPQAMQNFRTWYLYRFKPVYLSWKTAIDRQVGNVKIGEVDQKVLIKDKIAIAELSFFTKSEGSPYQYLVPPATGLDPLEVDLDEVNDKYNDVLKALRNIDPKKHDEKVMAAGGTKPSADVKKKRSRSNALEKISKPEDGKAKEETDLSGGSEDSTGRTSGKRGRGGISSGKSDDQPKQGFFHKLYFGDNTDDDSKGIKGFFEKFAFGGGKPVDGSVNSSGFAGHGVSGDLTPTSGQSKAERKSNFKKIMTAAYHAGEVHPAILAAQWALESAWGKKASGKNNLFGIKATASQPGTVIMTTEVINGVRKKMRQKFRDYSSIAESIKDRVDLLRRNPVYAQAGYYDAKTPAQAAKALQGTYATDPKYASLLTGIISGMGIDPNAPSSNFKPDGAKPVKENTGLASFASADSNLIIKKAEDSPISKVLNKGNAVKENKSKPADSGNAPLILQNNTTAWDAKSPANVIKNTISGEGILPNVGNVKADGTSKSPIDKANERTQVPRAHMTEESQPVLAARYARSKAGTKSKGLCAKYVRLAIQNGGRYSVPNGNSSAYMYATNNSLVNHGFTQIHPGAKWQVGDIMVFNKNGSHPHGHIQIWDGRNWISDFVQNTWKVYSSNCPPFKLFRDSNYINGAREYKEWTTATSANVGSADTDNPLPYTIGGGESTDAMGFSKPIVEPTPFPSTLFKGRSMEERMKAVTGYEANSKTGRSGDVAKWTKNTGASELKLKWNQEEKPDTTAIRAINKESTGTFSLGTMSPVSWKTSGEQYKSTRVGAESTSNISMSDEARASKYNPYNIYKSIRKGAESSSDVTMADDARERKFEQSKLYEVLRKGAEAAGDITVNPSIRTPGYFGEQGELAGRRVDKVSQDGTALANTASGPKSTGSAILDKVLGISKDTNIDMPITPKSTQSEIDKLTKGGFVDEYGRLVTKWGEPINGPDGSTILVDKSAKLDKRIAPMKLANLIKSKSLIPTESAKAWLSKSSVALSLAEKSVIENKAKEEKGSSADSKIVDPLNNPQIADKLKETISKEVVETKVIDKVVEKSKVVKDDTKDAKQEKAIKDAQKIEKPKTDTNKVISDLLVNQQKQQARQLRESQQIQKTKLESADKHTSLLSEQLDIQRSMDRRLYEIAKQLKTIATNQSNIVTKGEQVKDVTNTSNEPVNYGANKRIETTPKAEPVSMKIH